MKLTFKATLQKAWTLLDDKIIYGNKEIPLSSLTKAEHTPLPNGRATLSQSNGVIQVWFGSGAFDFATFAYPAKQNADGEKAAEYILSYIGGDKIKEKYEKRREIQEKGFRKRCKVCGKIMCYTLEDLQKNKEHAKNAMLSGIGVAFGPYGSSATNNQSAQDELSRIIDYDKCPSCGSRELVDLTDEDLEQMNAPKENVSTLSAADELKKFKELLDMGVITQEEFDAKKKQLLGL